MRLILIGPPAAGKGTQAVKLAASYSIVHLSTGQMLRDALEQGTELGKAAAVYWQRGDLVKDEVVIPLLIERIQQPDCQSGFLIDGFPRTMTQAETLDQHLQQAQIAIDAILMFEVPESAILERITGRRMDPDTGAIYHLTFNPPPPEISDRLITRPDDTAAACQKRLLRYRQDTEPVIPFYEQQGLLIRIDGMGTPEEVTQRILTAIEQR